MCQHTSRGNRQKKRFKCRQCGFQDHADRKAAVCIIGRHRGWWRSRLSRTSRFGFGC
uniref:zinc ribbon domain-containing protein n=1 Tax=Natronomonas pharaonis TaxID=2257 RepID=UPI00373AF5BF